MGLLQVETPHRDVSTERPERCEAFRVLLWVVRKTQGQGCGHGLGVGGRRRAGVGVDMGQAGGRHASGTRQARGPAPTVWRQLMVKRPPSDRPKTSGKYIS